MNVGVKQKQSGFTIVELLIVIVIIAILATISVVAYSGVQARGRDTTRKQDLATLSKVTQMYAVDKSDYVENGCGGHVTPGSGWLHTDYDGTGPAVSINDCLLTSGNLQRPITDPSGLYSCSGASCHAYMKVSCGAGTWYLGNLETLPQNSTFTDDKCNSSYDTSYGINYAVKVN